MHIIISPSKRMSMVEGTNLPPTKIIDQQKTEDIVNHIKNLSKSQLKKAMKLSDNLLAEIYPLYQEFDNQEKGQAIHSYKGFVYQKLEFEQYQAKHYRYMEEHIRILDAMYGLLKPSTIINEYRLDFLASIGLNVYDSWSVSKFLDKDLVINLASNEYAKMVEHKNMISIAFLQNKQGTYKNVATYTKQARGLMLNYMILNQIEDIDQIKSFNEDGYQYNKHLSSAKELVFIR